jgi:hypothetical protein
MGLIKLNWLNINDSSWMSLLPINTIMLPRNSQNLLISLVNGMKILL